MFEELVNPLDTKKLRQKILANKNYPYFFVDDFLNEDFATKVLGEFPDYDDATKLGKTFNATNEAKKVQVTDSSLFPESIAKLSSLLASDEFIKKISYILDIPNLVADPSLVGGGIHETSEGGRLDVHVDFNFNDELGMYRRANILIYFNKEWKREYGGILDLWDKDVKKCHAEIVPIFNRMACFATSETSYHGVTPIKCPPGLARKSFAAYYYTKEPPSGWDGKRHSTIFKARPSEWVRGYINMPMQRISEKMHVFWVSTKQTIKKILGRH